MASATKTWLKLARPKGGLLFFQILFSIAQGLFKVAAAIPAAQIISCATVANYIGAIYFVKVELLLCLVFCVLSTINLILSINQRDRIMTTLEEKLMNKVTNLSAQNTSPLSKQKIINTLTNDTWAVANYSNSYSGFFSAIAELLFVLTVLAYINISLSIFVFAVSLILLSVYFLTTLIEKRASKNNAELVDYKGALIGDVVSGAQINKDLNLGLLLAQKTNAQSKKVIKSANVTQVISSLKNIWVYFFLTSAACFLTFYLIRLLRLDQITLTLFILVLPYLTEFFNKSLICFNFLTSAKVITSDCERINSLINLSQDEIVNLGDNLTDLLNGNLIFSSVSLKTNGKLIINKLTKSFVKNSQNLCIFNTTEAKIAFLSLMRRTLKPTSGTITLDNINLYDFSASTYPHNVTFIGDSPYFFHDSILNNLKVTEAGKRDIIKALKEQKVYNFIELLPLGINSQISEITDAFTLYLLSIARAKLTKAEVIIFDGLPQSISPKQVQQLKETINNLAKNHTVIICSLYDLNLENVKTIKI